MFPGSSTYGPEFRPERGGEHDWHVHHAEGAVEVLGLREFQSPEGHEFYTVNFANGSCARIRPGDRLWSELADIAREHEVGVFPLSLAASDYVPWTGSEGSLRAFDAIRLRRRADAPWKDAPSDVPEHSVVLLTA